LKEKTSCANVGCGGGSCGKMWKMGEGQAQAAEFLWQTTHPTRHEKTDTGNAPNEVTLNIIMYIYGI